MAGVLTEATIDGAFASLFAQDRNSSAKSAVTTWATNDSTFIDAVAEKVPGSGAAEVTLAAMLKTDLWKWIGENDTWKSGTPSTITSKYSKPSDVKFDGAFLKLAINEDNETSIKLDAD